MIIDENKIEELIQKEVKLQVENKLKTFGRDAIKEAYKSSMNAAIMEYLKAKENELEVEIKTHIQYDADTWKDAIVDSISYQLSNTIGNAMRESGW